MPLVVFLGYSYYNYDNRRKAVDTVEEYRKKNDLTQICHNREMHFNVFDWFIEDKSQIYYVFVNAVGIEKNDYSKYWVQFSRWKDPQDLKTLSNYMLERKKDDYYITTYDLFWMPTYHDSLDIKEIKGTVFETVNDWIRDKYSLEEHGYR
jgi:hypothetical protein